MNALVTRDMELTNSHAVHPRIEDLLNMMIRKLMLMRRKLIFISRMLSLFSVHCVNCQRNRSLLNGKRFLALIITSTA